MGSDKGLLPFGGRRLIQVVLDTLRPLFPEVVIVANDPVAYGAFGVPVVADRIPGKGPLGGIHAALSATRSPHTFCVACDMPFVNPTVVDHLCALAPGYDASFRNRAPAMSRFTRSTAGPVSVTWSGWSARTACERMSSSPSCGCGASTPRSSGALDPSSAASFLNVNTPDES